jgi:hypothetical protein
LTADGVFERIDNSSGRLQGVCHEATAALPDLVGRLEEADKSSIPDRLFAPAVADDYGFFSPIMREVVEHLPAHAVDHWDERLAEAERSIGPIKDADRDWRKRAKAPFSTISSIGRGHPRIAMRPGIWQNSMRSRAMQTPRP